MGDGWDAGVVGVGRLADLSSPLDAKIAAYGA
jgi:hypothetical protein